VELRRLREGKGLTIEQVAEKLECSTSKISRIETARVTATPRDVRDMLEIYGVSGQERDDLIQIARDARQKGWWQPKFGDLPTSALAGLETEARSMRQYSALLVPGLLQTMDYARAVVRAIRLDLKPQPHEIERRVELRMERQKLLQQADPPEFWAVIDEAVLRRHVAGREAMIAQIEHLVAAAAWPNVTLQVLPFRAGAHPGLDGGFNILAFPHSVDPDVVYIENTTSDLYIEDSGATRRYALLFDHLRAAAPDPVESVEIMKSLIKEL
jgi:transcriptional regulator with XRE-family HTH domain